MKGGRFVLTYFLLVAVMFAHAQNIDGIVLNAETKEPVTDVFVFVANSSIGASTAKDGSFTLSIGDQAKVQLFFSHLSYEILSIEYEGNKKGKQEVFYLIPAHVELLQSLVVAKSKPGIRRRRLRDFTTAFLGEVRTNRIQIENSEAILFQEEDGRLIVETSQPIKIINKELGYIVEFYLESFEQWDKESISYIGSAFFQEMDGTRSQKARFRKNRKQAYERSSMKFFRDLAKGSYPDYQIGVSFQGPDGTFEHFAEIDSLPVVALDEGYYYSTETNGCLTIIDQSISATSNTNRERASAEFSLVTTTTSSTATSYLCPQKQQISFTKSGRILNAGDVEEFGYWTTQRVGSLLPSGYEP